MGKRGYCEVSLFRCIPSSERSSFSGRFFAPRRPSPFWFGFFVMMYLYGGMILWLRWLAGDGDGVHKGEMCVVRFYDMEGGHTNNFELQLELQLELLGFCK